MVEFRAGFRVTGVSYQRLRNHSTTLRLVMAQVRADGSRPVNIGMTKSTPKILVKFWARIILEDFRLSS
jgi:hypothetical protein